ncbi:LOW QUALITY PROTEIN: hypothetical protein QYF61_006495, partial [Mycteria americana]
MSLSTSSKRPLNTSRDGNSTTSLGSLFQCLITLSVKKNFLISNLNLPWCNLRPFLLVLSLVVIASDKVSPQPPFLQAKQPQLPQPLLIRLVLQTFHQLRCPSLDSLQHLNVSLWGPKTEHRIRGAASPELSTGAQSKELSRQLEKTFKIIKSTVNLTLPSPPVIHVPKRHIYTSFKYLQG